MSPSPLPASCNYDMLFAKVIKFSDRKMIYITLWNNCNRSIDFIPSYLLLDPSTLVSLFPPGSLVATLILRDDDIDFPKLPFEGPVSAVFVKACNALRN